MSYEFSGGGIAIWNGIRYHSGALPEGIPVETYIKAIVADWKADRV